MADAVDQRREEQREEDRKGNHREHGSNIGGSIFLLAFSAAGLGTTLDGKFRGDHELFVVAFAFAIAYSSFEILISIAHCVLELLTPVITNVGPKRIYVAKNLFFAACSIVAFALLVAALASGHTIDNNAYFGCANGFGCANIMAIIAAIGYGFRVLYIAITSVCLFCAACCACSACCIGMAAAMSQDDNNNNNNNNNSRSGNVSHVNADLQPPPPSNELSLTVVSNPV